MPKSFVVLAGDALEEHGGQQVIKAGTDLVEFTYEGDDVPIERIVEAINAETVAKGGGGDGGADPPPADPATGTPGEGSDEMQKLVGDQAALQKAVGANVDAIKGIGEKLNEFIEKMQEQPGVRKAPGAQPLEREGAPIAETTEKQSLPPGGVLAASKVLNKSAADITEEDIRMAGSMVAQMHKSAAGTVPLEASERTALAEAVIAVGQAPADEEEEPPPAADTET